MLNDLQTPENTDRDWRQLPIAELHVLDSVCDRFERAFAADRSARIENFLDGLTESLHRFIIPELVRIETDLRTASGENVSDSEFETRFPKWAAIIGHSREDDAGFRELDNQAVTLSRTGDSSVDLDRHSRDRGEPNRFGTDEMLFRPGTKLGHCEILELIGRGGMGIILRARETKLDRDVAIKLPSGEFARNENAMQRFVREARAAASVRHENVVTIHSVEQAEDRPFLVMELVEGQSLEEHLRCFGAMTAVQVMDIGRQVALGLAAAHRRGLVHRDIKPGNILLEPIGDAALKTVTESDPAKMRFRVKLTDFGLARAIDDSSALSSPGLIVGTPLYMSPEQVNGLPVDHRSDLFSLGSVMYTMCCGRKAFGADSVVAVLRKVADSTAEPLSQRNPLLPETLTGVVDQLMEKSRAKRIQSAAEVAELLNRSLADLHRAETPGDGLMETRSSGRSPGEPGRWRLMTLAAMAGIPFVLAAIFIIVTGSGEFVLTTDDPEVSARISENGGIVVEDRQTKQIYTLRQGKNRLSNGDYLLDVTTPEGLELTTQKFQIRRLGGSVAATVIAREPLAESGAETSVQPEMKDRATARTVVPSSAAEWTVPEKVPFANSDARGSVPSISGDGLDLVFVSDRGGQNALYEATRKSIDEPFGEPQLLPQFTTAEGEEPVEGFFGDPGLSIDGLELMIFAVGKSRKTATDLWRSQRETLESAWQPLQRLGPEINTLGMEYAPALSTDKLTLCWFHATLRDVRNGDIWMASRANLNEDFGDRVRLGANVNTDASEQHPCLSPDGLTLMFDRGTPEPRLWLSTRRRPDEEFGPAVLLRIPGSWENTNAYAPTLTDDGRLLLFTSNTVGGEEGFGSGELWQTRPMAPADR